MVNELYPDFEVPDIGADSDEYETEYKRSVKWDPKIGDFVRDSSDRLVECEGKEAYMIWCLKMVQTQRNSHLAYIIEVTGEDLGVDMDEALEDNDHEIVESMITTTIVEALEMNPRTEYVSDFVYSWDGDEVHFSFKIKAIDLDDKIIIKV